MREAGHSDRMLSSFMERHYSVHPHRVSVMNFRDGEFVPLGNQGLEEIPVINFTSPGICTGNVNHTIIAKKQ